MLAIIERASSILLGLAALVIAATLVHREFWPSNVPQSGIERPPVYVANWRLLLGAGHVLGDSAAPLKIIEFGDFECPYCRRADSTYHDIKKKYGSRLALVFVNFPLTMHRFAIPAARAAECAGEQGRFAEMHDLLYEKQDSLGLKTWSAFAIDAGVRDTLAFARCNATPGMPAGIQAGLDAGHRLQVNATPTMLVNGWRFFAPPSEHQLDSALAAITARSTRGVM